MLLSKEQKCLDEIIRVLARYGYELTTIKSSAEKKKLSVEEKALRKVKRIYGILKNYEKSDKEVLEKKYAGVAGLLGVANKMGDISQCKEIINILGDFGSIDIKNAESKIKEVVNYLESKL